MQTQHRAESSEPAVANRRQTDLRDEPPLEGALTETQIAREHRDGREFRGLGVGPPGERLPNNWIRLVECYESRAAGIDQELALAGEVLQIRELRDADAQWRWQL